jgi:hypothetical protein
MKTLLLLSSLLAVSSFAQAADRGGSAERYEYEAPTTMEGCLAKINEVARRFGLEGTVDHSDVQRYDLEVILTSANGEGAGSGYHRNGICYINVK